MDGDGEKWHSSFWNSPILLMTLFIILDYMNQCSFPFLIIEFTNFQVKKKRRVVGVVRCKNFKMDCPKVNCSEPVLLPGRCCKICPGENQSKLIQKTQVFGNPIIQTINILITFNYVSYPNKSSAINLRSQGSSLLLIFNSYSINM